jgi:predicted TIM-barrel fold metal-dependent hydrolase
MEVVDGQLHELAPWLDWDGSDAGTKRNVLTEVMLAAIDAVGVDAAVLFPIEDQQWAEEVSSREPSRFAWVPMLTGGRGRGAIEPDASDLEQQLETTRSRPGVAAIRIAPCSSPAELERFDAGGYDRAFAACEHQQIPVYLPIWGHLELGPRIAASYPELNLILDHVGLRQPPAETPDDPPFQALPDVLALAQYPNVSVKLCGIQALSKEEFPYRDVWPRVRELIDAFGAERLHWASDISRFEGRVGFGVRLPGTEEHYAGKHTYAESLSFYRDTELLSETERELILGASVRRILGWPAS